MKKEFDSFAMCVMVYLDMNLRETIPSQTDIEEFLARDFFPKYPNPMPLAETVDMVQLQFEVPDDARKLPCPRAHGTDGTILECLTWFAMKRLEERGFLVRVGTASYRWKVGVRYFGKEVSRRDLSLCLYRLGEMTKVGMSLADSMDCLRHDKWEEATVLAAGHKFNLTKA